MKVKNSPILVERFRCVCKEWKPKGSHAQRHQTSLLVKMAETCVCFCIAMENTFQPSERLM
jgi:hypothetical protein